ncbi:hypothetical protein CBR_g39182 [Chara braunii]|uniref:Myb/SANT-like DNA-binding domain-containing protein n=1 Tax=Chara braunii TaxID=69332 RepID=A0A388LR49_CHABU|nr:hypothetical protein CBR_g39182 [Chara braunii]|eukprot:GBG84806.1 hypothetical protein CBR_g39182 [Chara braunii]
MSSGRNNDEEMEPEEEQEEVEPGPLDRLRAGEEWIIKEEFGNRICFSLAWRSPRGGCVDMDMSSVAFRKDGTLLDAIFHMHLKSGHQFARHMGDDREGTFGEELNDCERIHISVDKIPEEANSILFLVSQFGEKVPEKKPEKKKRKLSTVPEEEQLGQPLTEAEALADDALLQPPPAATEPAPPGSEADQAATAPADKDAASALETGSGEPGEAKEGEVEGDLEDAEGKKGVSFSDTNQEYSPTATGEKSSDESKREEGTGEESADEASPTGSAEEGTEPTKEEGEDQEVQDQVPPPATADEVAEPEAQQQEEELSSEGEEKGETAPEGEGEETGVATTSQDPPESGEEGPDTTEAPAEDDAGGPRGSSGEEPGNEGGQDSAPSGGEEPASEDEAKGASDKEDGDGDGPQTDEEKEPTTQNAKSMDDQADQDQDQDHAKSSGEEGDDDTGGEGSAEGESGDEEGSKPPDGEQSPPPEPEPEDPYPPPTEEQLAAAAAADASGASLETEGLGETMIVIPVTTFGTRAESLTFRVLSEEMEELIALSIGEDFADPTVGSVAICVIRRMVNGWCIRGLHLPAGSARTWGEALVALPRAQAEILIPSYKRRLLPQWDILKPIPKFEHYNFEEMSKIVEAWKPVKKEEEGGAEEKEEGEGEEEEEDEVPVKPPKGRRRSVESVDTAADGDSEEPELPPLDWKVFEIRVDLGWVMQDDANDDMEWGCFLFDSHGELVDEVSRKVKEIDGVSVEDEEEDLAVFNHYCKPPEPPEEEEEEDEEGAAAAAEGAETEKKEGAEGEKPQAEGEEGGEGEGEEGEEGENGEEEEQEQEEEPEQKDEDEENEDGEQEAEPEPEPAPEQTAIILFTLVREAPNKLFVLWKNAGKPDPTTFIEEIRKQKRDLTKEEVDLKVAVPFETNFWRIRLDAIPCTGESMEESMERLVDVASYTELLQQGLSGDEGDGGVNLSFGLCSGRSSATSRMVVVCPHPDDDGGQVMAVVRSSKSLAPIREASGNNRDPPRQQFQSPFVSTGASARPQWMQSLSPLSAGSSAARRRGNAGRRILASTILVTNGTEGRKRRHQFWTPMITRTMTTTEKVGRRTKATFRRPSKTAWEAGAERRRRLRPARNGRRGKKAAGKGSDADGDDDAEGGRHFWSVDHILALIRAKHDQDAHMQGMGHAYARIKPQEWKWLDVAQRLKKVGFDRDTDKCGKTWDNLMQQFKKVHHFNGLSGEQDFFQLSAKETTSKGFNFNMDRAVFGGRGHGRAQSHDGGHCWHSPLVIGAT